MCRPIRAILEELLMLISRRLISLAAGAALFSSLVAPPSSHAVVVELYAVTGAGGGAQSCAGTLSTLYALNPPTAAATPIGPVMLDTTQLRHITGLAIHPSTGVLYAVMNGQEEGACGNATLLTINPA